MSKEEAKEIIEVSYKINHDFVDIDTVLKYIDWKKEFEDCYEYADYLIQFNNKLCVKDIVEVYYILNCAFVTLGEKLSKNLLESL